MTRELAEDLVAEGHDITVLAGWPNHPEGRLFPDWSMRWRAVERVGGYRVMRVWHTLPDKKQFVSRIIWFVTFAISSFANILACRRFDVVYSHTTPIFGPLLTLLACRLKGMKYVYGIYDIYPEAAAEIGAIPRGKVYNTCRKLDTFVCHNADSIPTLGEGQKATLMARGISGEKIPVIPFWIDAEKVKPLPRDNPRGSQPQRANRSEEHAVSSFPARRTPLRDAGHCRRECYYIADGHRKKQHTVQDARIPCRRSARGGQC
jgi:glycosyltransferase involved in cell wall biosynthesis